MSFAYIRITERVKKEKYETIVQCNVIQTIAHRPTECERKNGPKEIPFMFIPIIFIFYIV